MIYFFVESERLTRALDSVEEQVKHAVAVGVDSVSAESKLQENANAIVDTSNKLIEIS